MTEGRVWVIILCLFVVAATIAPWITNYPPNEISVGSRLQPPSVEHFFGTDMLGRDVFSRIVYAGRTSLTVAFAGVALSLLLGLLLAALATLGPRWLDMAVLTVIDGARAFPVLLLAMAVAAIAGPGISTILAVVVFASAPTFARFARTQIMSLRDADFIVAERLIGHSAPVVFFRHLLPNISGPLLTIAAMEAPSAIAI